MDEDRPVDNSSDSTTGQADPNTEESGGRRGFLRSLIVEGITVTAAGSVLLSRDAELPEGIRSSENRERKDQAPEDPVHDTRREGDVGELSQRLPAVRIPFEDVDFEREFTERDVTDYNEVVGDPAGESCSLRVAIPEGNNYGTSMRYVFEDAGMAEPTELHSRYYFYVPSTYEFKWDDQGKLPGPAGTYGEAG